MISIQNIDDKEYFKWSLVRYLNPIDHHSANITKAVKYFSKKRDFKGIKLSVKCRNIYKIEKKNSIGIGVFGYENKEKHSIYVSKNVDLLLKGKKGQRHYAFTKDFNTFMYYHTLHLGKTLLPLLFTVFST